MTRSFVPALLGLTTSLWLCSDCQAQAQAQVWTNIGPLSPSYFQSLTTPQHYDNGRVASVAIDPTDPTHWLIGAGQGGVWESHDSGATWASLTDTAPTPTIGAVAFAPSNPKTIYAGTGESDGGVGFEHSGLGMLTSTDGGQTWALIAASNFARGSVRRIRVHPTNPNIVLAASSRSGYGRDAHEGVPSPPAFGILLSADGGMTWAVALQGQATALEINPTNFNNQYAAIGDQRVGLNMGDVPGSLPNGVYRSTDGGQTWAPIAGPWGASTSTTAPMGRIELAMAPSNPNTLYASMQIQPYGGSSGTGLLGLYRTDNAWAATPTWVQVPTAATGAPGYSYCYDGESGCGYVHVLTIDPTNPNTAYAGGAHQNLWKCTNCAASPTWVNTFPADGTVYGDLHDLAWAGSQLIMGNDHGVWSTPDGGATWQDNNATLNIATFYSGALHPTDPDVVLGSVRDLQGVQMRTGYGIWTIIIGETPTFETGEALGEAEIAISSSSPDTNWMLAENWGGINRTTDGGQTWIEADAGIDLTGSAFVPPVRKCPSNDDVFLAGMDRLWRTNGFFSSTAPSWVANNPPNTYPNPDAINAPGTIFAIEYLASDTSCNTYAYGNRGGSVQLTHDGGTTWTNLDPNQTLPPRPVNWLAFDPTNSNIMYAALSSFDDATPATPGHVFKTTNAMAATPTWVNVSPPLNQPFNVVAVDPSNPLLVYAGSDLGLWSSADGANTWTNMGPSTGLPNVSIYDIKINSATGMTVAFTYGRGAYALGPPPTTITFQTSPPGLQFTIDGSPTLTAPQTVSLMQGTHTILAVIQQPGTPGSQYAFSSWSDGGSNSHDITVGSSPATYTATFNTQYQLTTSASPAAGGVVKPTGGPYFFDAGSAVGIGAIANTGYQFVNWTGNVADSTNPATTVTMSAPETVIGNFLPVTAVTIQTNLPGLLFSVDGGAALPAPQTLSLTQTTHTIAVAATQAGGVGTQYVFNAWSDGGAPSHSITVGTSPATYTATFTAQYLLTTAVSPAGAGTVTAVPSSSGYYNQGTGVQLTASPNPGYEFSGWAGFLGGSTNPQSFFMNGPRSVTANFSSTSCSFVFTPASTSLPPTGTSTVETCPDNSEPNCGVSPEVPATFTVTASAACGAWTATSSNPEFLQITSGGAPSGPSSGAGTVGYTVLNNTHNGQQSYTITVASGAGSATYSVTEAGSGDNEVYRQVYALYEQLLGRDPDPAGFAFWSGAGGAGLGQMADSFLTSPEAFNSDFAVMAAYQAATGAPPTYAQFAAAVASLRAGTQSVPGLFNALIGSGYTSANLCHNLLNRATTSADSACINTGLSACFQTIIGYPSNITPVGAANNEFQSTGTYHTAADHTNGLYVQMVYYVTLSRDPDPAGLAFWTGIANGGGPGLLFQGSAGYGTRIQILGPGTPNQGFIGSPEFQGLFAN